MLSSNHQFSGDMLVFQGVQDWTTEHLNGFSGNLPAEQSQGEDHVGVANFMLSIWDGWIFNAVSLIDFYGNAHHPPYDFWLLYSMAYGIFIICVIGSELKIGTSLIWCVCLSEHIPKSHVISVQGL